MDLIPGNSATASALQAQAIRLETIAQNIANAGTTRGPDGKPYQRQVVSFQSLLDAKGQALVKVSGIQKDQRPGPVVNQPGHPHADAEGNLQMPNVLPSIEMVDLISASHAYEANLSVAKTSREMALKTLEIGRR